MKEDTFKLKVYRVELMVKDFDNLGAEGIKDAIENQRYPNDCICPKVITTEEREVTDYNDNHPLNQNSQSIQEFQRLFS